MFGDTVCLEVTAPTLNSSPFKPIYGQVGRRVFAREKLAEVLEAGETGCPGLHLDRDVIRDVNAIGRGQQLLQAARLGADWHLQVHRDGVGPCLHAMSKGSFPAMCLLAPRAYGHETRKKNSPGACARNRMGTNRGREFTIPFCCGA